jgi:hypothetical protein
MKRVSSMASMFCLSIAVLATGAFAQAPAPKPQDGAKPAAQDKAPASTEKGTVVFLGNATCPGDSKPVDREKFVEVDGQRVYVCSDDDLAALKKDPSAAKSALAKAYPTATPIDAKKCSCGEAIEAGKSVDVTFQGRKAKLCCADCVTDFKKSPVTAMTLMTHPDLKDAKNLTDPIDGKPVDPTIIGIYKTHLIHFGSWTTAASFEKDPSTTVAKLKLSS